MLMRSAGSALRPDRLGEGGDRTRVGGSIRFADSAGNRSELLAGRLPPRGGRGSAEEIRGAEGGEEM